MEKTYVRLDEHGVYRVGDTRVMLDGIVYAFKEGDSPETIIQHHTGLGLEDAYGAITYYLAHKEEVEAYLQRQKVLWEKLRAEQDANPPPVIQRLLAIKQATMKSAS